MTSIRSCCFRNPFLLVLTGLLAACAQTGQPQLEPAHDWTPPADFTALRMEIGASPDFAANCGFGGRADNLDEISALLVEENWVELEKAAEAHLKRCPVDIEMHMYRAIAFEELGREDEAQPHIEWYRGLLDSIMASGDGRSAASPFVTISIAEEYNLIHAFGLEVRNQSVTNDDQDMFRVVDKYGDEHWMFFYPELHWERLRRMFRGDAESRN